MTNELVKNLCKNKQIKKFITDNALDEEEVLRYFPAFSQFQEMDNCCKECDGRECLSEVENMTCDLAIDNGVVRCVYKDCDKVKAVDANSLEIIDYTPSKGEMKISGNRALIFKKFADFITNYENSKGLVKGIYLHGQFGVGKSFILYEFAKTLASKGISVVFVYYPDFVRRIQSSFGDGESVEDFVYRLKSCDILMLDDLGRESNTSYIRDEILGPILQFRCDNFLPMFATSNRNFKLMKEHLSDANGRIDEVKGRAIISRLEFLMEEIELKGEDFRKLENL